MFGGDRSPFTGTVWEPEEKQGRGTVGDAFAVPILLVAILALGVAVLAIVFG